MIIRVVILAAGKGKRMHSELPKVLIPFRGKPMIEQLLASVREAGIDGKPIIVIGNNGDLVQKTLGEGYEYIVQEQQLGTGHAVAIAVKKLPRKYDAVMVLYGDQPFIKAETIRRLAEIQAMQRPALTMTTTTVRDFKMWRKPLYDFGRIIRNQKREITSIIEKNDANEDQLKTQELNASFFCFRAPWLKEHLSKLTDTNAQKEYYLTDLVGIAIQEGALIASLDVNPLESIGVNTPEHLETIHALD
jgi:bifunctional UDP-N-acetylglucosamine pyrophosphorylase/glucosamine-1-phosphate N-acetyltransferase